MERSLRAIYQRSYGAVARTRYLSDDQRRAAHSMMACRTAKLGGHLLRCERGHVEGVWYNSCRHRSCPRCASLPRERWLERQRASLLDCAHRHLVFTVPHELNGLWLRNRAAFTDILFRAVKQTVLELFADERYVGAKPGMILALHSWGRALSVHPHIHALVTEGGADEEGQWVLPRRRSLLPYRVLRALYQGKLRASLIYAVERDKLRLPRGYCRQRMVNELNRLGRVPWHVKICDRYGHGVGVATYLARYLRGGPLSERQLRKVSSHRVSFSTKAHEGERRTRKTVTMSSRSFIVHHLQHVAPRGQAQLRRYGLYANGNRERLNLVRRLFGQPEVATASKPSTWEATLAQWQPETGRCSRCQAPLHHAERLWPARDPPPGRGG